MPESTIIQKWDRFHQGRTVRRSKTNLHRMIDWSESPKINRRTIRSLWLDRPPLSIKSTRESLSKNFSMLDHPPLKPISTRELSSLYPIFKLEVDSPPSRAGPSAFHFCPLKQTSFQTSCLVGFLKHVKILILYACNIYVWAKWHCKLVKQKIFDHLIVRLSSFWPLLIVRLSSLLICSIFFSYHLFDRQNKSLNIYLCFELFSWLLTRSPVTNEIFLFWNAPQ